jgi:Ribbon-helix-helix protein, copG family
MMPRMRTTVTLDADLAAKLRTLARERGVSFKEALNSTLRRGLTTGGGSSQRRYRLESRRLGLRPGVDLEHALRLASELEDAETIRKLELRK